jgi:hypothetical protein
MVNITTQTSTTVDTYRQSWTPSSTSTYTWSFGTANASTEMFACSYLSISNSIWDLNNLDGVPVTVQVQCSLGTGTTYYNMFRDLVIPGFSTIRLFDQTHKLYIDGSGGDGIGSLRFIKSTNSSVTNGWVSIFGQFTRVT